MFAGFGSLLSPKDKRRSKRAAEAPADAGAPAPQAAAPQAPAPEAVAPETVAEPVPAAEPETVVAETVVAETTAEPETAAEPEAVVVETVVVVADVVETVVVEADVVEAVVVEADVVEAVATEVTAEPETVADVAETTAETEAASALPLANYDELSVASLRARLRNLSVEQLTQLIGYEKGHAGRADVIAMFERRIAKVESEA
jgi:hypothetical protein